MSSFIIVDGKLFSTGNNEHGQLGLGDCINRKIFTKVPLPANISVIMVSSMYYNTVILDNNGDLWETGDQDNVIKLHTFSKIQCDVQFRFISCGYYNIIGIDSEGYLWEKESLSKSDKGISIRKVIKIIMGKKEDINKGSFIKLCKKTCFTSVSCGYCHSIALDIQGNIWVKGDNSFGQLGISGCWETNKFTRIKSETIFTMITAGYGNSMALDNEGNIWITGDGSFGQLGIGKKSYCNVFTKIFPSIGNNSLELLPISFIRIAANKTNIYAIDINNDLWVAGLMTWSASDVDINCQLKPPRFVFTPNTNVEDINSPINCWLTLTRFPFLPNTNMMEISFLDIYTPMDFCTSYDGCVFLRDTENNLWAMGNNNNGQLGINSDSEYILELIKVPDIGNNSLLPINDNLLSMKDTQFANTPKYNRVNMKGSHTSTSVIL